MQFDIEQLEREHREDAARVAAIEARHKATDAAFQAAVKTSFDALAEPWRALGEYIRATDQSKGKSMSIASALAAEHGERIRLERLATLNEAIEARDWSLVEALRDRIAKFYFSE